MTTIERVPPLALPAPGRLGQGTAVEMSRAVAEVHAAAYAAQQFPRNEIAAIAAMENSCRREDVAGKAFYRMPRAGGPVTGPTVKLAKELARCWGHIQHGITELRRDDEAAQSEMQAFAWDVQTGTRTSHTFIVPHKRDKTVDKQTVPVDLDTLQAIYENNANNGARRLRECIFGVLPSWFTERAQELCRETMERGDGKPLKDRVALCVKWFAELGVTEDMLVRKLQLPRIRWTGHEVAHLGNIFASLKRNEITVADEFPPERVTVAEVNATPAPTPTAPRSLQEPAAEPARPVDGPPTPDPQPVAGEDVSQAQQPAPTQASQSGRRGRALKTAVDALHAQLADVFDRSDRGDRLDVIGRIVGQRLAAAYDMTPEEVERASTVLGNLATSDRPAEALELYLSNPVDEDEGA